jgi:hypothetical protein
LGQAQRISGITLADVSVPAIRPHRTSNRIFNRQGAKSAKKSEAARSLSYFPAPGTPGEG